MKPPPLRVIFDRSAFHGARFWQLRNSRLKDLCRSGRMTVFHTQIFLEETISAFGAREGAADWREHLSFALEICNGGIFLGREKICHDELVAGRGTRATYLLPERRSKTHKLTRPEFIEMLQKIARTGDATSLWSASEAARRENRQRKRVQKELLTGARKEVAERTKKYRPKGRLSDYSFAQCRDDLLLRTGKKLMNRVSGRRTDSLADQWAQCPERFPFYSAFVEGFLYASYHAAVKHNERIDGNAQADFIQLAYLTWADIIVSNDQRFLRQAFEAIWKPRRKRLETAQSFAELANRIA